MTSLILRYPVLFARASLKPAEPGGHDPVSVCYPVLFARASLKPASFGRPPRRTCSYPVLFARASLKLSIARFEPPRPEELSRAFCAGLIEA